MYVLNKEKRLIILGDGVRVGGAPGQGTKLFPGKGVHLNDVPKHQRDRFVLCVKQQLARGRDLEVLDAAPENGRAGDQLEALRVQKNLDKLDALTAKPEPEGDLEQAPEEDAPRKRRARKEPLGGE